MLSVQQGLARDDAFIKMPTGAKHAGARSNEGSVTRLQNQWRSGALAQQHGGAAKRVMPANPELALHKHASASSSKHARGDARVVDMPGRAPHNSVNRSPFRPTRCEVHTSV